MGIESTQESIENTVVEANEKLAKAGAAGAEQSFSLGCALVAVPLGITLLVLYAFGVFNLIMVLVALIIAAVALLGILTLVSAQARSRSMANLYAREIEPEIDRFLNEHSMTRQQFDALAHKVLTQDAPLRVYLLPPENIGDAS